MRFILSFAATVLLVAAAFAPYAAAQQPPTINVPDVPCMPSEANGVIYATVNPEVGGAMPRLFFRWDDHGAMYWLDMVADGGGRYWAVPPKPEPQNSRLEYYVASTNSAGRTLARSESMFSPVDDDCSVELTPRQVGVANNLVIGETIGAQEGNRVLGFLCDGIVSRVNPQGILRPDEVCRGCVIPWWAKEEYLVPAAAVPAAGLLVCCSGGGEEASVSRP